jgi:putative phosphoesterase
MHEAETIVGVISDTHGLLRPQAIAALNGAAIIFHAGDVGKPQVIEELRVLGRIFAVRGNVDAGAWAARLPMTRRVEVGRMSFFVLHRIAELDFDPAGAGIDAVVFGHSHRPSIETREGVLFLNPGSAGHRRFRLPVTVARVSVSGERMRAEIVELVV